MFKNKERGCSYKQPGQGGFTEKVVSGHRSDSVERMTQAVETIQFLSDLEAHELRMSVLVCVQGPSHDLAQYAATCAFLHRYSLHTKG